MNDNRDQSTGAEVYLLPYFLIDRELFDLYSFVPDFRAVEVREHRLLRGQGRRLSIQITDIELFLRVTVYRFCPL